MIRLRRCLLGLLLMFSIFLSSVTALADGTWTANRTLILPLNASSYTHFGMSPGGSTIYIPGSTGSPGTNGKVYAIDTSSLSIIGSVSVGYNPIGVAISPDGTVGYATNAVDGYHTTKFNAVTMAKITDLSSGTDSSGIIFAPDGGKVYTTCHWSSAINVYNVATNTRLPDITGIDSGGFDLAITPDGQFIYALGRTGNIYKVSTASNSVVKTIPFTGSGTMAVTMSPAGDRLFVTGEDKKLHVFSTNTDTETYTSNLGSTSYGADLTPDGNALLVSLYDLGQVAILSGTDYSLLQSVTVPANPGCIEVAPDGLHAYVVGQATSTVTELTVPEPGTLLLLALSGLSLIRRRRA